MLDYWVRERDVEGLRVVTWTERELMLDDPCLDPLWQRASELRIPVCVLTNFHQVPLLRHVLERFGDIRVALDHLGLPRLTMVHIFQTSRRSSTSRDSRISTASSLRGPLPLR